MKAFSTKTKAYILATLLLGAVILAWQLSQWEGETTWLVLAVGGLACATQILKVEGTTARSSYNISWVVYGFTLVLLGAPAALLVILVAHIAEWVWHRYQWFVQTFNMASYAVALQAASLAYTGLQAAQLPPMASEALAILVAMAAFTLTNHLLVGIVIWLARGENFAQSGVFGLLTLMIDFSLLCLGAAAAIIWTVDPLAVVMILIPLYLIYSTLRVPALERQTDTDPKTGLFNARYFNRTLEKELARAHRAELPITVVVADLDLLRNINNTYGHLAGDAVLSGIAQILQRLVRTYDVVARFGGEEFAILMPGLPPEDALPRVEEIRLAIEASSFEVSTSVTPIRVTMSFGVAGIDRPDQPANDILHNADVALYHSKLTGRNRVTIYSRDGVEALFSAVIPAKPKAEEAPLPQAAREPAVGAPSAGPTSAAPRVLSKRPRWMLNVYIGTVATLALVLTWIAFPWHGVQLNEPDWIGLGLFALFVIITEGFAIDLYIQDTSVSTSVVPFVSGVLLFGPMGAITLALALTITAMLKHNSPLSRFVFNVGNHLVAGMLSVLLAHWAGGWVGDQPLPVAFGITLASAAITYLISTSLVTLAIALDSAQPARRIWSERFRWLAPYYLVMGVTSFILVKSYMIGGAAGALAMLLPVALLRFGQKQYIDRTKSMVTQLRVANEALVKQSHEVSTLNEELLMTLAHAVDLRDPYVMGHSHHVARYATLVAAELGLPPEQIELIRKAGLLHDIGKLGISDVILFKPGALTAEEYEEIKRHAVLGAQILENSQTLHPLVPIVRYHHERYDGKGYPDQRRGDDIPLEARIMALADTVEAMASDRPYRRGASCEMIVRELKATSGTQFDPQVVEAFCRVIEKNGEPVIINSAREVNTRLGVSELDRPGVLPAMLQRYKSQLSVT